MPSVKSIKNLNCPCIISPAPPPSPCNPPSPPPRNQPTPRPPPPHTTAKPPEIPASSPPYYFHPSTKSHAPLLAPPPYFTPNPNSPPFNALKTGGGGGNHTTIIVVCTSLGGLFFLAFLSVGIFFSAKKTKLPSMTSAAVPSAVPEPQRAAGYFGGEVGTTSKAADKGMHGGRPPSHEGGELAGGATAPPKAPQPYGGERGGGKEIGGANEGVNTKGKKGYLQDQSTGPCGGEDGSSAAPEKGNGGELGGGDEGTNTKAAGDRDNLLPDESTEPHGGEDDGSAAPEKGDGDEKIDDGDLHKEATEQYGGDQDDGSAQPENFGGGEEIGDGDLPAEEATEKDGGGDDGSAATEKVDGGEETGGADNRERNALKEKIKKIAASRKKRKGSRGSSTTATITAATAAVTTLFKAQTISEFLQDNSPTDQANESSTTPITDNDPEAADESNTPTPTDDPHADESSSTTQTDNSKANYSKNEATKEQFFEGSGDRRSRESEVRPQTQVVDPKLLAHQRHKNKAQQYDSENTRGKKLVPHTQKSREFDEAALAETALDYYYHGFDSCLKQISTHLEAILVRDAGLDTLPEPQDPQSHEVERLEEEEEKEEEEEEEET